MTKLRDWAGRLAFGWVGVGLLLGSVAVTGYALLFARPALLPPGGPDEIHAVAARLGKIGIAVPVVGLVVAVVIGWRWSRGRTGWRGMVLFAAIVMAGLGWWLCAIWRAVREFGFPGDRALLTSFGAAGVLAGAVVVLVSTAKGRVPVRASRRAGVAVLAGVLAVAAGAGVVVAVAGEGSMVDSTTASGQPSTQRSRAVKWQWHGSTVWDVVPAGAGVIALSGGGVVAIDGATGAERWHYRRKKAGAMEIHAVAGGDGVAVLIGGMWHVFDAFTGELWWWDEQRTWSASYPRVRGTASNMIVFPRERISESQIVALDVRTGEPVWRWTRPADCEINMDPVEGEPTVIVPLSCQGGDFRGGAVGLDAATGKELWRSVRDRGTWVRAPELVAPGVVVTRRDSSDGDGISMVAIEERTGRDLAEDLMGDAVAVRPSAGDGFDSVTEEGVREFGATELRWHFPTVLDGPMVQLTAHIAVLVDGCGAGRLAVLDANSGAEAASLCLPAARDADPDDRVEILSLADILVVRYSDELVGFSLS